LKCDELGAEKMVKLGA